MKIWKYGIALTIALFCLTGCAEKSPEAETVPATEPAAVTVSTVPGTGTVEYPWQIGKGDTDSVTAFWQDDTLWITGEGDMMDFASPEDRPWNSIAGEVMNIFFDESIAHIGQLAFANLGTNQEELWDLLLPQNLVSVGDRAFEGANLSETCMVTFGDSVEAIGSRAFAGTRLYSMYLYSHPEIAEDAFAGVTAEVTYVDGMGWKQEELRSFGGELTWRKAFLFSYETDCGTEDYSSSGTLLIPEGEELQFDAVEAIDEEPYRFLRYEILEGSLGNQDLSDSVIERTLNGNVRVRVCYEPIA